MKKSNRIKENGAIRTNRAQAQRAAAKPAEKTAWENRTRETTARRRIGQVGKLMGYVLPYWIGEDLSAFTDEPKTAVEHWFEHVAAYELFDPKKEHLVVLILNTKFHIIGWNLVSVGTLDEALSHPREVLRPAIAAAAKAIVIMHNHPSGNTAPSVGDCRCTDAIQAACDLMQIRLLDHVIVGRSQEDAYFSFYGARLVDGEMGNNETRRRKIRQPRPKRDSSKKNCPKRFKNRAKFGEQIGCFVEGDEYHTLHKRGRQFWQAWNNVTDLVHSPVKSKRVDYDEAVRLVRDNILCPAVEKAISETIPPCMRGDLRTSVGVAVTLRNGEAERKAA